MPIAPPTENTCTMNGTTMSSYFMQWYSASRQQLWYLTKWQSQQYLTYIPKLFKSILILYLTTSFWMKTVYCSWRLDFLPR